jgi:tetratricopeptide (TPR) repeat protein
LQAKVWIPLALFAALAAWMFLAARTPTGDEDLFAILSPEQYNETLKKVQELTFDPIVASDQGKKLGKEQVENLRKGSEMIRQMIAFEPTNFGPYAMMAKTKRALGEMDEAVRNYKQALLLIPKEITDEETLWTAAEVHHDLATFYYDKGDDKNAEEHAIQAVMLINDNPKYLIALAAVQAQLGKVKDARSNLDVALGLDPENPVGKTLDAELKKAGH